LGKMYKGKLVVQCKADVLGRGIWTRGKGTNFICPLFWIIKVGGLGEGGNSRDLKEKAAKELPYLGVLSRESQKRGGRGFDERNASGKAGGGTLTSISFLHKGAPHPLFLILQGQLKTRGGKVAKAFHLEKDARRGKEGQKGMSISKKGGQQCSYRRTGDSVGGGREKKETREIFDRPGKTEQT